MTRHSKSKQLKLVLFDIDGTLLLADGQGRDAMENGIGRFLERDIDADEIDFGGRTDLEIIQGIVEKHTDPSERNSGLIEDTLDAFVEYCLSHWQDHRVKALPGAVELVLSLANRTDLAIGLVTGNAERTAYRKLKSVGLEGHFPFGAFGDDHENRTELLQIALRRAADLYGREFRIQDACVVGDTTRDIRACRNIGMPCLAVASGFHSRSLLTNHSPDALLDSLSDTRIAELEINRLLEISVSTLSM